MDIVISFEKYIPKPNIFLGHFELLKNMKFIEDVKIIENEKSKLPHIEIVRKQTTNDNESVSTKDKVYFS